MIRAISEDVLQKLANVSITARQAVESILTGAHRSVRRGLSIEFAGHREYLPGDDLRHLDWFVYARSDRFDIRLYEEETKLRATLVVDTSGSMGFSSGKNSKIEFARSLAAALGFLMVRQSDSIGLATCDTEVRTHLPPASTMGHYLNILEALEKSAPGGETHLSEVLDNLACKLSRRGLVILISDCFDDAERLVTSLQLLRHRKQDVRVFQIIDPSEENFPFNGMIEFVGLEKEPRLKLDTDRIRERYRSSFAQHQQKLAEGCRAAAIALEVCRTDEDLAMVIVRSFAGAHRTPRRA